MQTPTFFFTSEIENIDKKLTLAEGLHFYRIVQESLTNIIKHSEAREVLITVTNTNHGINATIEDNGKGFDFDKSINNKASLGMKTLFERAKILKAKITFLKNKPSGTRVYLQIPTI